MQMSPRTPVAADSVAELAAMVSAANGDGLADRVKLLGLEIDEQAIILDALDDPPDGLADLRGVLINSTSGAGAKDSTRECRSRRGAPRRARAINASTNHSNRRSTRK